MKKEQISQTKPELNDEGQPLDKFGEMLAVMDVEWLLRFQKRLEKIGRKQMVKILDYEIKAREAVERKDQELRYQQAKLERLKHKGTEASEPGK
jgi:hypothetical protein